MKSPLLAPVFLLIIAASATFVAAAAAAASKSPDATVAASRRVAVWTPPDSPPPNVAYAIRQLLSPDTLEAVAKELDIPSEARKFYRPRLSGKAWGWESDSEGLLIRLDLPADNRAVPQKAGPFLDALLARFQQWLDEPDRRAEQEAEKYLDMAHAQAARTTARLSELRDELRKVTGRVDVSPEGIRATVAGLEQERQRRELQLAGAKARHQALQQAVESSTKRARAKLDSDEIAKQLLKVVELRENEWKRVEQLVGQKVIAQSDVDASAAKLAEAKTALLQRQEAVAGGGASGGDADKLVQQMEAEALNVVEAEAVLGHVRNELDRLSGAGRFLDDYERLMAERDRANAAEAAAQARRDAIRTGAAGRHPVVVVKSVEDRGPGEAGDPPPTVPPSNSGK